ncbi:cytochrome P450 [Xylaria sp. FL1777]|nr:cytochrome P450 [Xylaria sp. FL1777]
MDCRLIEMQADSYKVLIGYQNGQDIENLVSTREEKKHEALRRSVAGSFTSTAALDYEKWFDVTIGDLLETLTKKSTFDLTSVISWYSMDAASRVSFSVSLGCLAAEADVGNNIQIIRDSFVHWTRWSSYPRIERLVHRNPIFTFSAGGVSSIAATAIAKTQARMSGQEESKEEKASAVAPDLLDRFLKASKDHPQLDFSGIIGVLMSTIAAGADTTAVTIVATLFYLLKNPEILEKLEAELTGAGIHDIPAFAEVSKLPYLNAVLKESMRLFALLSFPMERLVPAGGATIAGMYFPEGTTVGCLPAAIHLNKDIFGDDVEVFRPERWLTNDQEQLRVMEAAHMGFSRGRRSCIDASLDADHIPNVAVLEPVYVKSEIRT